MHSCAFAKCIWNNLALDNIPWIYNTYFICIYLLLISLYFHSCSSKLIQQILLNHETKNSIEIKRAGISLNLSISKNFLLCTGLSSCERSKILSSPHFIPLRSSFFRIRKAVNIETLSSTVVSFKTELFTSVHSRSVSLPWWLARGKRLSLPPEESALCIISRFASSSRGTRCEWKRKIPTVFGVRFECTSKRSKPSRS